MTDIQPIDSAFTGGVTGLVPLDGTFSGYTVPDPVQTVPDLAGSLPVTIAIILSTVVCIASLRTYISIIPSVAGCVSRWKGIINLEDNVLLSISRDRIFYILILPFCILASSCRLYDPEFMQRLQPGYSFLVTTGIFLGYLLLRKTLAVIFQGKKVNTKTYTYATHSFRTFFIITVSINLLSSWILGIFGVSEELSGRILLYEGAAVYLLFMLRKTQIFKNSCSLISAILYLCALEFLPTGILVATAIVL